MTRALLLALVLSGCAARSIVDLHVDLPYALDTHHELHASARQLQAGGVGAIVTPLFVLGAYAMSPRDVRDAYATRYAELVSGAPHGVETWLSFEGADGFVDDAPALDAWMSRGACLVGLVHDHANALGGASQDPSPAARARGLSEIGKRIAAQVLAHGALLDAAHASDATFDDLAAIARTAGAPLVDSHTGMRALRAIMRNIDDAHMRMLAATGGIVGISVHGGHVGHVPGEPPTLSDVADHLMHAVEVAGIDHVALGSDFDGGITPPRDADGESMWPRLRVELEHRGLGDHAIDAIFGGNARRVFGYARAHGCTPGAR